MTAGCKVNLYLEIVGVRPDGYHLLDSLFYPLRSPQDTLTVTSSSKPGLSFFCSNKSLNTSENILVKTYAAFSARTGFAPALYLELQKNIPMGAGLGGGSSDAAAFLSWLNDAAGERRLSARHLQQLALELGADVPFFLQPEPAWIGGIGEVRRPAQVNLSAYELVLVCPGVHVDTAWAYREWDRLVRLGEVLPRKPLTEEESAIKSLAFTKHPRLQNCFEGVVFRHFPVLHTIKQRLLDAGALSVVMSGSGSSLVGLFASSAGIAHVCAVCEDSGCRCFRQGA